MVSQPTPAGVARVRVIRFDRLGDSRVNEKPPWGALFGAASPHQHSCCVAQMIMSAGLRFIRYPVLIKNNGKEQALG